jgi:hypothetical protein
MSGYSSSNFRITPPVTVNRKTTDGLTDPPFFFEPSIICPIEPTVTALRECDMHAVMKGGRPWRSTTTELKRFLSLQSDFWHAGPASTAQMTLSVTPDFAMIVPCVVVQSPLRCSARNVEFTIGRRPSGPVAR